MWQICGYIPQTIMPIQPNITQRAAQLSTSFFIETFIHAKEKVNLFPSSSIIKTNDSDIFLAYHGTMGRTSNETV